MTRRYLYFIIGGVTLFILIIIVSLLSSREELKVTSVSPINGATNISLFPTFSATFSRAVAPAEQKLLLFSASPEITGEQKWSADRKTLTLTPSRALQIGQKYVFQVAYREKLFSWSFTTSPLENLSYEDQIKLQAEADKNFGKEQEEVLRKYPWYLKLPLLTERYFVYFNLEKEAFVGKPYAKGDQSAVEPLKQEVISALEGLEIDIFPYQIIWEPQ